MANNVTGTSVDDAKKRVSTACEACRIAKIRCRPSAQPGVCQKCSDSKTECVSRVGPRTRRSKVSKRGAGNSPFDILPPPPKPTGTFTIDFAVPAADEVDQDFETLRDCHASHLEAMFPLDQDSPQEGQSSMQESRTAASGSRVSTNSSSGAAHSIESFQAKPQFNIASAETLLLTFHSMVQHFPCIHLKRESTVPELASTRPFVLLAILAAASASKTLQGHSLYDEEFRKVLGLKIVTGGESSLELLQGILIYSAWYPFHLRPKNKQTFQYMRMATDLVHTLELDVEKRGKTLAPLSNLTEQQLDEARAYLGYCYVMNTTLLIWRPIRDTSPKLTPWTEYCCTLLEQESSTAQDAVLASLARQSFTTYSAMMAINGRDNMDEQQKKLVMLGLESQNNSHQSAMASHIARSLPIKLQSFYVSLCLDSGNLLHLPKSSQLDSVQAPLVTVSALPKVYRAVETLRQFFKLVLDLPDSGFVPFTRMDWAKLIFATILALRLSFPFPGCPEYDDEWARSQLHFEAFLDTFVADPGLTGTSKKVDVLSASRVVMGLVKDKYAQRMDAYIAKKKTQEAEISRPSFGCPFLDGSMEKAVTWDTMEANPEPLLAQGRPGFTDLWTTMTTEWMNTDVADLEDMVGSGDINWHQGQ